MVRRRVVFSQDGGEVLTDGFKVVGERFFVTSYQLIDVHVFCRGTFFLFFDKIKKVPLRPRKKENSELGGYPLVTPVVPFCYP